MHQDDDIIELLCTYKDEVYIDLLVPPADHVVAVHLDCLCCVGPSIDLLLLGTHSLALLQKPLSCLCELRRVLSVLLKDNELQAQEHLVTLERVRRIDRTALQRLAGGY